MRKIDAFRTLTTESLAVFMPFRVQEVYDKHGIYYGQNVISKNMMIACCNDGTRPVIFKIERIDIPETDEEKNWPGKRTIRILLRTHIQDKMMKYCQLGFIRNPNPH